MTTYKSITKNTDKNGNKRIQLIDQMGNVSYIINLHSIPNLEGLLETLSKI